LKRLRARLTVGPMKARALLVICLALGLAGCPKREGTERAGASPTGGSGGLEPAASVSGSAASPPAAFGERTRDRERMVRDDIAGRDVRDQRVLAAMRKVPRHAFVPEASRDLAYADRPLPIGHGQTISQPYIVAFMSEAAAPRPTDRCLEIGTGSGYQAAVLAELCRKTHSIEYLPEVARRGESNLRALGYGPDRVELRTGDGYRGWPEAAPFDVVLVTAAPERVPRPLLEQLAMGGRLVIPVGSTGGAQELERWTRTGAGQAADAFERKRLMSVRFVPFLGEGAKGAAP
jgi:protein-L-isoaspartate(D-aspartate) O-methyltransferase